VEPASGAVIVTVGAPAGGGPVASYALTVTAPATGGGSEANLAETLTAPGTVTVPVEGCALATAFATATGPGGTSARSAPAQALGCVPPGAVRNMTLTVVGAPINPWPHNVLTWDPPADTGGGPVDYVVTVTFQEGTQGESVEIVTAPTYERGQAAGRDPYTGIRIAARNAAGTGPAVVAYP
jgi:hypothetical protein